MKKIKLFKKSEVNIDDEKFVKVKIKPDYTKLKAIVSLILFITVFLAIYLGIIISKWQNLALDIIENTPSQIVDINNKDIERTVDTAIRALTFVSDKTDINQVPTVKIGNNKSHAIGLGAMNLHGYLVRENILYTSEEAKEFSNVFFALIRYYAIK